MLLTLAMLVFFASIFVFFSQEFIRTFKRIFEIPGAKLVIPLAIGSWLVLTFDYWFLWAIYYCREILQTLLTVLVHIMPFQQGAATIALIILLTVLSVFPVFVIDWIIRKRTYNAYRFPYLTSTLIWISSAVILLLI